ncbi:MAG: pyruvate:ferredoxin (flavodoxin) oxidoreductase [Cyanobium sp.]
MASLQGQTPSPMPIEACQTCLDGNEAVARVAYRLSDLIALYPITPATPMGEWADTAASEGRPNLWGTPPCVVELQSEAGAAGTLHGALQAGALATTFTASQGLLLMLPTLVKLAGELMPVVLHVAARALAAQGLSIFGDHGDVMAIRSSGCAILFAASVQEAGDFAAIASRAALLGRSPFVHGFDGFRTSHEIQKVWTLPDALLQAFLPAAAIEAHRQRALHPSHPVLRGTAQNPDVYFQGRESVNPFVQALPEVVQQAMDHFAQLSGRRYGLFEYEGPADADRVLVLMGSGCETASETLRWLHRTGERVGLVKVRLFRPFAAERFVAVLPSSTRAVAVLDRCKEAGASGEPLKVDVIVALQEHWSAHHPGCAVPLVLGGRYGLGSKEFTPAMVKAIVDTLAAALAPAQGQPRRQFTVGIEDDVSHLSLAIQSDFVLEGRAAELVEDRAADRPETPEAGELPGRGASGREVRAIFYGLGSDGTVGTNKSTIRIIGEQTDLQVQAYFVYDSKKAGSVTISHLRFGPRPIRAPYLIQRPTFVAAHQWDFVTRFPLVDTLEPGGTLLLNSPFEPAESWQRLPERLRQRIRERRLQVWQIQATRVAREAGMGPHINTVMQACFFALSGVLPREQAIACIRAAIEHSYGRKGEAVVAMNLRALEASLDQLHPIPWQQLPDPLQAADATAAAPLPEVLLPAGSAEAPPFVREVIAPLLALQGDQLPVSALPCDGTWPTGTARWEKRNIATVVPQWHSDLCVQCGKCVMVCPHAVIRAKVAAPELLAAAPPGFAQAPARDASLAGEAFTIQVAVEDCTGCSLCVEVCPARDRRQPRRKALEMVPQRPLREQGRLNWDFFLQLPEAPRPSLDLRRIAQQQLQQPLFEFPGACAGCGETPYLKLASQLFGDRMLVANATGCSSIYGGNLPTTPWSRNAEGRGPAWCNSLFEDNAEFGLGLRLALDQQRQLASDLLRNPLLLGSGATALPQALVQQILTADQGDEAGIAEQRQRLMELRGLLRQRPDSGDPGSAVARLLALLNALEKSSVWLVGGDGWAYDIGFGGLDHVLASGADVNVLVLDTEVYSNTGGQRSKSTPLGAVAKFAAAGKETPKKDLGLMAMSYGSVYVASVAMGARDEHTIRAFLEAESYPGPSLILAYSHCIAHGIDMTHGMQQQKLAVDSGRWLLYRYDPRRAARGEKPLQLDSPAPKRDLAEVWASEGRFRLLQGGSRERQRQLQQRALADRDRRWSIYRALSQPLPGETEHPW